MHLVVPRLFGSHFRSLVIIDQSLCMILRHAIREGQ